MAFSPGDKIKYHTGDEKWKNGKIHAVRKVDTAGEPQTLAYLIDTGKENPDHVGREDRQPEQVDVRPENVKSR